jgi:hypothetical protein
MMLLIPQFRSQNTALAKTIQLPDLRNGRVLVLENIYNRVPVAYRWL